MFLCVCVCFWVFFVAVFVFFFPITTLDIIYAGVVLSSRLIQCGEDWTHIHSHYFFYFFLPYIAFTPPLFHTWPVPLGPSLLAKVYYLFDRRAGGRHLNTP